MHREKKLRALLNAIDDHDEAKIARLLKSNPQRWINHVVVPKNPDDETVPLARAIIQASPPSVFALLLNSGSTPHAFLRCVPSKGTPLSMMVSLTANFFEDNDERFEESKKILLMMAEHYWNTLSDDEKRGSFERGFLHASIPAKCEFKHAVWFKDLWTHHLASMERDHLLAEIGSDAVTIASSKNKRKL